MFLSHFSGSSLPELFEMDVVDIYWWYNEAVKLHNKLNRYE